MPPLTGKTMHVLCDLFDVLVKGLEGTEVMIGRQLGLEPAVVAKRLYARDFSDLWLGKKTEDLFLTEVLRDTQWEMSLTEMKHLIRGNFYEIAGTRQVYEALRVNCPCSLYSVAPPEWISNVSSRFPYDYMFSNLFYSYEIGFTKRQIEGFKWIIERLGCAPSEVLLIDDSRRNLETARASGLHGLLFQSPSQIRADLVSLGLL